MTAEGSGKRPSRLPGEFPIELHRKAGIALPVQLAAALRESIDRGVLRPGERVPATRELGRRLGVARGVVVAAYEQLIAEGYLSAGHGHGTTVNAELLDGRPGRPQTSTQRVAETALSARLTSEPPSAPGSLAPGRPITYAVDRPAWRAAWRSAAARAHVTSPPLGDALLREEIADHLRQMRGTTRPATDIIVTAGTRDGLGLLLTALGTTRGNDLVVGVEDPGYPSLRGVAARHGARIVALPVDGDGLRTEQLPSGVLDVVIVTPSHQYPIGGSLPLTRRRELIAWARLSGAVIVEDDYDSELRHAGSPLPALAALDDPEDGVVVTLGTFSSTITPALAAGFMLAPAGLRSIIEPVRRDLGSPVSTVVQLALAEYLASGELKRNIARVRRLYAARRDRLSDRLAGIPQVRVRPMSGGLHAVIEFGTGTAARTRETEVLRKTQLHGIGAALLGGYWQRSDSQSVTSGIVIGMGGPDTEEFEAALEVLREILRQPV